MNHSFMQDMEDAVKPCLQARETCVTWYRRRTTDTCHVVQTANDGHVSRGTHGERRTRVVNSLAGLPPATVTALIDGSSRTVSKHPVDRSGSMSKHCMAKRDVIQAFQLFHTVLKLLFTVSELEVVCDLR